MDNRPLRVACAVRTFHRYGGVPRSTYELVINWGKQQGTRVTVITAEKHTEVPNMLPITLIHLPVLRIPGGGYFAKLSYALEIFSFSITASFYLWLHRKEYDILYAPTGQTCAPCVYTSQSCHRAWITLRVKTGDWAWLLNPIHWWILFLEWYAYRFGRSITAISDVVARDMMLAYQFLKNNPPVVIPHGVNIDEFKPDAKQRNAIRKELRLADDDYLLLFVGYEYERKGLPKIIEVLPRFDETVHLAVVGEDFVRREKLKTRALELGVGQRVHFLGTQKNVAPYFQAADLFVFPSKMDAFALVVLEAMASGLPVITTKEVGASVCVGPEGVVLDVPVKQDELASAIRKYVADTAFAKGAGEQALRQARRYSWEKVAQKYIDYFRTLL